MKKEIKGYKLKDEKYKEAAEIIAKNGTFYGAEYDYSSKGNINRLKEAGVLDLWFEPVYKEDTTLEVGKWYKNTKHGNGFAIIYKGGLSGEDCFGIGNDGAWVERYFLENTDVGSYQKATDKEVEEALIKEAKKRGFKEGDEAICLFDSKKCAAGDFYNLDSDGDLWLGNQLVIFSKGNWAEIIEGSNKLPEINGYQGEDKGTYLKYGCAEIPKVWFENTEFNRSLKSIKLSSGVKIGKSEIEQISEYLNAK